jgi:hypothetical protein
VDKKHLEQFVDIMQFQLSNLSVQYEHLEGSESKVHSKQSPFYEETFAVFARIVDDFYLASKQGTPLTSSDFSILNKIMQTDLVTSKLFKDPSQASLVLLELIEKQTQLWKSQNPAYLSSKEDVEHMFRAH